MQLKRIIPLIITFALLVSCSKYAHDNTVTDKGGLELNTTPDTVKFESEPDPNKWKTIKEEKIDLDNDNSDENVKVSILLDNSIIQIKIDDIYTNYRIPAIENIDVKIKTNINIEAGLKGVLINVGSIENANVPIPDKKINILLIGYKEHKIITLLNSFDLPINSVADNYKLKHLGNNKVYIKDEFSKFDAEFEINIENIPNANKRLKQLETNENNMPQSFCNVEIRDLNSDKLDEIICTKSVPGIYHNRVFGFLEYTFYLDNNNYSLKKVSLKKMFDDKNIIKETTL